MRHGAGQGAARQREPAAEGDSKRKGRRAGSQEPVRSGGKSSPADASPARGREGAWIRRCAAARSGSTRGGPHATEVDVVAGDQRQWCGHGASGAPARRPRQQTPGLAGCLPHRVHTAVVERSRTWVNPTRPPSSLTQLPLGRREPARVSPMRSPAAACGLPKGGMDPSTPSRSTRPAYSATGDMAVLGHAARGEPAAGEGRGQRAVWSRWGWSISSVPTPHLGCASTVATATH